MASNIAPPDKTYALCCSPGVAGGAGKSHALTHPTGRLRPVVGSPGVVRASGRDGRTRLAHVPRRRRLQGKPVAAYRGSTCFFGTSYHVGIRPSLPLRFGIAYRNNPVDSVEWSRREA